MLRVRPRSRGGLPRTPCSTRKRTSEARRRSRATSSEDRTSVYRAHFLSPQTPTRNGRFRVLSPGEDFCQNLLLRKALETGPFASSSRLAYLRLLPKLLPLSSTAFGR